MGEYTECPRNMHCLTALHEWSLLCLVRREVIGDHMNFLALGLMRHDVGEEGNELGRGVARGSFIQHLTGLGIEGCVERQGAVSEDPVRLPRHDRRTVRLCRGLGHGTGS